MENQTDTAATDSTSLEKGGESPGEQDGTEVVEDAPPKPGVLPEVPEGGTKAYLSVIGAAAAMFASFGWVNCIGIFQAEYETHQLKQYTSSEVSWITSSECTGFLPVDDCHTK